MKGLRLLFHTLGASLSLGLSAATASLLLAALGLGIWSGSEGSLEQSLRLLTPMLPAGQSLQVSGVTGTLRSGGHIEHAVWGQAPLSIEAQGLDWAWDWRAALRGELRLTQLHAKVLHINDRSPASDAPWTEIRLPLRVDAQVTVDRLLWAGPPEVQLDAVQGHYRFDGKTHTLEHGGVRMASGRYQLGGSLQSALPGTLNVRVTGIVDAPVRIQQQTVVLAATASVKGTLYGKNAALDVLLDVRPQDNAKAQPLGGMKAHLQATVFPAAAQPLIRAHADWQALDIARLWPKAPQTALSGQAQVAPDGNGWKAALTLQNSLEGPVNLNRLPLQKAEASVVYRNGHWQLHSLQALVAGGVVSGEGSYAGAAAQWSAHGVLKGLIPAKVDTRWPSQALAGDAVLQQTAEGIAFDAQFQTAGPSSDATPHTRLQTKGRWNAPSLHFDKLQLQTPEAHITGQLQVDTRSYAVKGQVSASLPGAEASISGDLAEASGQGSTDWQVKDANALLAWLTQLPFIGGEFQTIDVHGAASVASHWRGGWQNQGRDLQLGASVQSKKLELQGLQLSDLKLDMNGTLQALAVQLFTRAQAGTAVIDLQSQSEVSQSTSGHWTVRVKDLQASVLDGLQPVPWKLQLQQALEVEWRSSALTRSMAVSAGTLVLRGPAPGTAQLQWEPVNWSHIADGRARWSSKGNLQALPLAWLEALGQTRLANLGLRGDLLFGGQWDARSDDGLQLRARFQRSSGDLQLLSGDASGGSLPAGIRDAHVDVQVDHNELAAQLIWASDAGGNAQADFSTRLQGDGAAVRWAPDAPLKGTVKASLPRVGAWSLVAPVGWRINGTLEADASLGGTRSNPLWKGSLDAHDMAIRSVVDGIDLSNGAMRLALDGRHMEVVEFSLQGAGGANGGQLRAAGAVDWLPAAPGVPWANRLRMALDANAQAFRVTARPDQRLVVSGSLSARLQDAKLSLYGALAADQALIVLPEDSAPKLAADVTVRRNKTASKAVVPANDPASSLARSLVPDLQVTLDPGPNFQLQGHGINTRLVGQLTLKAQGKDDAPRLTGELRTVNGFYRAYGQRLTIDEGTLRFTGAYDNPGLDIRAVRPNLQQVVGVQVSGTAQLPVVRLFAEPELSEMEKLSWLVLGRSSANGGGETAILQQAALALFAGSKTSRSDNLINAFGLDEVSLGQAPITNLDGSTGSQATVKIGKRLSRDFYVAYERSLAGTLGTLYVFYDLSRRFTLRGESGTTNAVDLIFTTRYN